jgi:hypothetical protein
MQSQTHHHTQVVHYHQCMMMSMMVIKIAPSLLWQETYAMQTCHECPSPSIGNIGPHPSHPTILHVEMSSG